MAASLLMLLLLMLPLLLPPLMLGQANVKFVPAMATMDFFNGRFSASVVQKKVNRKFYMRKKSRNNFHFFLAE